MDVTPESRYGDLVRQLNEYGNPPGVRALVRTLDPGVAVRTVVEGALAFVDGGSADAADRVLRHAVHVGIAAGDIAADAYQLGLAEGLRRRAKPPAGKTRKAS